MSHTVRTAIRAWLAARAAATPARRASDRGPTLDSPAAIQAVRRTVLPASVYNPAQDNPIQETDRVPFHATNPARSTVDPNNPERSRSGWTWKTVFEYLNSNLWQGEVPPAGSALAMTWMGQWKAGLYNPGAVVRDDLWTMIANKQTSDKAAPVLAGSPGWGLPDVPTWSSTSPVTSFVTTGIQITGGLSSDMVLGMRVWIPAFGANISYRVIMRVQVSLGVYRDIGNEEIFPAATGWYDIAVQGGILDANEIYEILLLASDDTATTDFNGRWLFTYGTANYTPTVGDIYNKTNENLLLVHNIDGNLDPQGTNLDTVIPGTRIEFANGAIFTVDALGVVDPTVHRFYGNFTGFPVSDWQTVTFRVPTDAATEYVHMDGWWTSNPPPDANVLGMISVGGAAFTYNDNAYGVDLLTDAVSASPDWEIVALSDNLNP